ncbi:dsRBD fold-containing protein [Terrabacter sp. AAH1]
MRAHVGDRIILAAEHVDEPTRDGEVLEVRGPEGGPPYLVRWGDGRTGLIYPGPGAVLRIGAVDDADAATGSASSAETHAAGSHADRPHPHSVHLREWQVRVSLLESGDDTSATVVLVADSPDRLRASGTSHRSADDTASREIGDEVAVARALRHLADQLVAQAEKDIERRTGEEAHVRAT